MAPFQSLRSPLPRWRWIPFVLLTMLAAPVPSRADSWTLGVAGTANLYGAGHATPPAPDGNGAGILPPGVALPSAPERVLRILSTSGTVRFSPSAAPNGADGAAIGNYPMPDWGGLSAYRLYNIARLLSGVFLSDSEPADPPPAKLLADSLTFPSLAPALRQIFPIGDGLVGTAAGDTQLFVVPAGATRLFLGFLDSYTLTGPGWYGDNSGLITVSFGVTPEHWVGVEPAAGEALHVLPTIGNALRGGARVRFVLPMSATVRVEVYDVTGRLLRAHRDPAPRPPGLQEWIWDGRDGSGARVPAGLYLARVSTPFGTAGARVLALP